MSRDYSYENIRRVRYGDATFVPVCEKCFKFVKPDKSIKVSEVSGLHHQPNARCAKCGRTHMLFEGFI